ncbi:MAG: OmpA family protein [Pseudomonadota bacterium]
MIFRCILSLLMLAAPAVALDIALPGTARQTAVRDTLADVYQAPIGVFSDGAVPRLTIEGAVNRSAWRIDVPGLTSLQVMKPLRSQLEEAGFDLLMQCESMTCGGFDFRFAIEVLPGPHMYVNIRDYQFVSAVRAQATDQEEVITLLTSASETAAYAQIVQATPAEPVPMTLFVQQEPAVSDDRAQSVADDLETALLLDGHVVLSDLNFEVGTTDLGAETFETLIWLAAFLQNRPDARVALVGHTDTVGALQGNIALSRQRAQSVRQRLIETHGIAPERLDAEGMGYLSPLSSNSTEDGRQRNRRVEVVLLSNP